MKFKRAATTLERRKVNAAFVELMTARQKVFSGYVAAVKFSPVNTVVEMEPNGIFYFGQIAFGELTLRIGGRFHFFAIIRATASVQNGHLTVVAETIERLPSSPRNCSNPACNCGRAAVQANRRRGLRSAPPKRSRRHPKQSAYDGGVKQRKKGSRP